MDDDIFDDEEFKKIYNRNIDGLKSSQTFVSIFSESAVRDPQCMMQFGAAVMLDKPIMLIVVDDTPIPDNLKKLAVVIEKIRQGHKEDMQRAVNKISEVAKAMKLN